MLKRFVARLLIITQIYGNLFQGLAHAADLADGYQIRNQIHLQSSVDEHGGLRLRLGTDGIDNPKELKWFDIPTDDRLKLLSKKSPVDSLDTVEVEDDTLSQYSGSGFSTAVSLGNESDFESKTINSTFQGTYFTLQGLSFAISNTGAIRIKGKEADYSKPMFLSGSGSIVLDNVEASVLNLTAPQIAIRGLSKIDCLRLDGISVEEGEASFVHSGHLIAKQIFLNNLKSKNTGTITSGTLTLGEKAFLKLSADSRTDVKTLFLNLKSHLENHGKLKVGGIQSVQPTLKLFDVLPRGFVDAEFENQNGLQLKISASRYLRLFNALSQNQPYIYDYANKIDPAVANLNGLIMKQRASSYKKFFIERYEKDVVRSTTEGSLEEQAELQRHLKQFEPYYQVIRREREKLIQASSVVRGAGLLVDSLTISAPKLYLLSKEIKPSGSKEKQFVNFGTIVNESRGKISFKPDTETRKRYLRDGMNAELEEDTCLLLERLSNSGTITSIQNFSIHSDILDNTKGHLHSPGKIYINSNNLSNNAGSLSGMQGTEVVVRSDKFSNQDGEIGASRKTSVSFKMSPKDTRLGTIQGTETWVEDASSLGETLLQGGKLIGLDFIRLQGHKMLLPGVLIQTPKLHLNLVDFLIDSTSSPHRTIIERATNQDLRLTHPYFTAGTLEIRQAGITSKQDATKAMIQRFGMMNEKLPKPTHTIAIQAPIKANRGMVLYAPAATFGYGDNGSKNVYELLLEKSALKAYVSAFDVEKGTLAIKNLFIHAPLGIHFGRLIQDPGSNIFATFCSHSQSSGSLNLGGDILVHKYEVLGKEISGVYDGSFLLTLPKVAPNETSIQVEKASELHGPLLNHSDFSTHDLLLDSATESLCEASQLKVRGNFTQAGTGNLLLKRHIGTLHWTYHNNDGYYCRIPDKFCNSDPASFMVYGELSQSLKSTITNEASILYAHKTQDNLKIQGTNFTSRLFQKEYTKEEQQKLAFIGAFYNSGGGFCRSYGPGITYPTNSHDGDISYAMGFLQKTNNFAGAKKVFVSETSFGNGVIIESNQKNQQLAIGGDFSAPLMLIKVGNGGLVLGTQNPFYIEPKNLIRDLMTHGFRTQNTYVMPDVRKWIDQTNQNFLQQHYGFKLQERYFHHPKVAQAFYQDLRDDIVVCDLEQGFKKATGRALFSLSPQMLLDAIRKECQETLHRGYFDDNQTIDYDVLKQLHRNASAYVQEHRLLGKDLSQALVGSATGSTIQKDYLPTNPMIFYDALMNMENVEELVAKLYVPRSMMDDARGKMGGKIRAHVLAIFPQGMTNRQMLEAVQGKPAIEEALRQILTSRRLVIMDNQEEVDPSEVELGSVTLNGEIQADNVAIFSAGDLNIHAYLQTKRAIIGSLFGNVILKSLVERTYLGNLDNFRDTIPLQARIEALYDTLDIFAKNNIMFVGAQTYSAKGTYLEALGSIYDVPAQLVSQSFFCHSEGWSRDKWVSQVLSSHKSDGNFESKSGEQQHLCTNIHAKNITLSAKNEIDLFEVQNLHEHQSHTKTDSNNFFGGTKTVNESSFSSRSIGSTLAGEFVNIFSEQGDINLINVSIDASKVDFSAAEGLVRLMLGTNSSFYSKQSSSSNMVWQSQSIRQNEARTYSTPTINGDVEIHSKGTIVQQIGNNVPEYAKYIQQHGGNITYQSLVEFHKSISESHQGPTAAFAALVSIAISIATAGTGSGLGVLVAEGAGQVAVAATATTALTLTTTGVVLQGMTSAFFTTLCSQAALAVLNSDGKPENALKSLTSPDSLKSLLTSTLKGSFSGPSTGSFVDKLVSKGVNNTIGAGLDKLVMNKPLDQGMKDGWINAGIDTVAQVCANKIGDGHNLKKIDGATRDILHFGLGASIQSITDLSQGNGFDLNNSLTAGGGAVVGHKIAEGINPTTGRILVPFLAFLLRQNPNIAFRASQNSIDNNLLADHQADPNTTLAEDIKERMEIPADQEGTPEQIAYEQGLCAYVMDKLDKARKINGRDLSADQFDHVIELSRDNYAQIWVNQKGFEMLGNSVVGVSEWLIPGLEGLDQAWMGTVNYYRGNLTKNEWKTEVYNGYKSVSVDGAVTVTTMGVGNTIKPAMKAASKFIKFFKMPKTPIQTIKPVFGETLSTLKTKMGIQKESINQIDLIGKKLPANRNNMQPINNNRQMPWQKQSTGTYGDSGLVNQGKQPTLNSLAKNYGGSESNAFFKPMMSKDTLNNQIGGSQLGSISEQQTFGQIGSKEVSQSVNKLVQKSEVGDGVVRPLLQGEGNVGTYKDLLLKGHRGDNLTPNHMPQFAFMEKYGIKKSDGVSMMMEQPVPGVGGRHRQTNTYGKKPDLNSTPRQELAKDLVDVKNIYKKDGVYTAEIKKSLLEVAEQNKQTFPELFKKVKE